MATLVSSVAFLMVLNIYAYFLSWIYFTLACVTVYGPGYECVEALCLRYSQHVQITQFG